jgi:hypothetical protein
MNKNIEVINEYLWTVKFSLIPFIQEINSDGDLSEHNHFILAGNGTVVLNQESNIYEHIKDAFLKLNNRSNLMLNSKLKKLNRKKNLDPKEHITNAVIRVLIESRKLR